MTCRLPPDSSRSPLSLLVLHFSHCTSDALFKLVAHRISHASVVLLRSFLLMSSVLPFKYVAGLGRPLSLRVASADSYHSSYTLDALLVDWLLCSVQPIRAHYVPCKHSLCATCTSSQISTVAPRVCCFPRLLVLQVLQTHLVRLSRLIDRIVFDDSLLRVRRYAPLRFTLKSSCRTQPW